MAALEEKTCTCCEETKSVEEFYRNPSASGGHSGPKRREPFCKECSDLRRKLVHECLPSKKTDCQNALGLRAMFDREHETRARTPHDTAVYIETEEKTWRKQGHPAHTYLCALTLDGEIIRYKIGVSYDPRGVEPRCNDYAIVWDDPIPCCVLEGDFEKEALRELKEFKVKGKKELFRPAPEVFDWFDAKEREQV